MGRVADRARELPRFQLHVMDSQVTMTVIRAKGCVTFQLHVMDSFYPIRDLQPPTPSARTLKEICGDFEPAVFKDARAVWDIFAAEASSAYAPFLEFYVNATHDLIEDNFKRDLELVKCLLKEYEKEYAVREKLIITESGKHIYIKKQDDKIMLSGDTFPVKDEIKKRGFKWDPLYKVWYAPAGNVDLGKLLSTPCNGFAIQNPG